MYYSYTPHKTYNINTKKNKLQQKKYNSTYLKIKTHMESNDYLGTHTCAAKL